MPGRHDGGPGAAPLAAFLASLAAFAFCVFASTLYGLHSAITGPLAAVFAVALVASGVWLNRAAGRGDGEDDEPERRPECPCGENHPELPEHGERGQS